MNENIVIESLPMNGAIVLICIEQFKGVNVLAEYVATDQCFILALSGLSVPAINVIMWKTQTM